MKCYKVRSSPKKLCHVGGHLFPKNYSCHVRRNKIPKKRFWKRKSEWRLISWRKRNLLYPRLKRYRWGKVKTGRRLRSRTNRAQNMQSVCRTSPWRSNCWLRKTRWISNTSNYRPDSAYCGRRAINLSLWWIRRRVYPCTREGRSPTMRGGRSYRTSSVTSLPASSCCGRSEKS